MALSQKRSPAAMAQGVARGSGEQISGNFRSRGIAGPGGSEFKQRVGFASVFAVIHNFQAEHRVRGP